MAFKCCDLQTKYITWNIPLPHPHRSCNSPNFSLDGFEWCFIVNCTLKQVYRSSDCISVETWRIKLASSSKEPVPAKNYVVVPYIEKLHPVYEREAANIDCFVFDRNLLGIKEDSLNMLFLLAPESLRISNDIPRAMCLKPRDTANVSTQTLSIDSLSKDMVQLLDSKEHSDVILKCGDSSFPVHKNVLGTRSDVFAAMFRQDMSESRSGVVDIVDLNSSVLEEFVRYLYSDSVEDMTMDKAIELYQVAEKYAVHSLKLFCGSFMLENLSKEVVCEILLLADQVGDSKLLEAAACFAAEAEGFVKTEEWRDFAVKHANISTNVFLKYVNKS